ncbi:uncharacterized protein LOC103716556 isoform X3 [Phoenix dactylifera]|uniref:Uncharacterized protein LOC103716556 isoform X3 n=1 Tax=Phoenix dactylifera TaxID=42345 RepID=A0A8B7CN97_PHODC|nr:uncharacterized protein LOC103716556 isoform X3 [Phoenix dactylifera]
MKEASSEGESCEAIRSSMLGRSLSEMTGKVPSAFSHAPPPRESSSEDKKEAAPSLPARNASSKYDFVKVKVWLGDNADHYYVLSRFLLSRMLTVTKIPNHVAIKIALELKKLLVDNSLLDVSQSDLEANLFKLMERRGYGEEYINRYKMMTRFHHQRVPLVILVCGTACVGKSTIATQLAQRLNLPNVLQTDMVYELLRTSTDAPLTSTPVWSRDFNSSEELITEFCRECRIVRKGLAGDLKKAMKDGKPIIIEGIHLDPSMYLMDEENRESVDTHKKNAECGASNDITTNIEHNLGNASGIEKRHSTNVDHSGNKKCCPEMEEAGEGTSASETGGTSSSKSQGEPNKELDLESSNSMKKERSAAEPIIIPIVLKMVEFDHKALLEEWIATRAFGGKSLVQDQSKLISNLKTIQDYLCSFESQGLTVAHISATTFPQTLDWLHNFLLQCIEKGVSAASCRSGKPPAEKN